VAALPPQPPGGLPPQPPVVTPPVATPAMAPPTAPPVVAPPQAPYPGGAYSGQMPAQPYGAQPVAAVPKHHKRTFFLTLAQFIMILLAIVRILIGVAFVGFGVYILIAGSHELSTLPGYDQYVQQFGSAVVNLAATLFFIVGAPLLVIGIVDLVLGIIVGRPSNVTRWIIIVLDVLSAIGYISLLSRANGSTATLILLVLLACKVIVFYSLAIDPATRRNFAGKAY